MIRLFLSTDVAGSTLYKSQFGFREDAPWPDVFRCFFSNYPILLTGRTALAFEDEEILPSLSVWKVMGDEAIFTVEPTCGEHVVLVIRALFSAMVDYEKEYFSDLPLRLKSTAWLATFPRPNIEIEIPELGDHGGVGHIDYIGPDIDLGFRLGKYARPSMITVSLKLAEVMLEAGNVDLVDFILAGHEPLKGVFHDRPYPITWVRPAGAPLGLAPWEIRECPLLTTAATQGPTSHARIWETIEGARDYLRKMQGARVDPVRFGGA